MSTQVGAAHIDVTASTVQARRELNAFAASARTQLAAMSGVTMAASVKLSPPTRAEVAAALSGVKAEKTVTLKVDSADAVTRIGQVKALLGSLGTTVQGLFQVNTSGFGAILSGGTQMVTQFRGVVGDLNRVLTEIRTTRPSTAPPTGTGSSAGSSAGNEFAAQLRVLQGDLRATTLSTSLFESATRTLKANIDAEITSLRSLGALTREQQQRLDSLRITSGQAGAALSQVGRQSAQEMAAAARQAAQTQSAAVAQLGRELQLAQSQYQRGALGVREYLREIERVRGAGQSMAAGLQAGSREAQALERVMAGFSRSRAALNDQSIVKLRSDLAGARAEFERATAAAGRFNFVEQRRATQAYEAQLRALETRIRAVGERSTATATQVRTLNQMSAQIGSQRNLLNGSSTGLGVSGSVLNALRQLPQFAAQAGGSLGAAAAQATGFSSALGGVGAAAGPVGVAVVGLAMAVTGMASALASTVGPAAQFQQTLVDIKALTQPTTADLAALKQATMDIGTPLGVGARDAAAAVLELNKAGLDAKDAVGGGLAGALTLAGAAGINAAEGSRIAVGAMTAFGLAAQDLPRVADVFANFSNKTFLGAEDLSQALAAVGPVAKSAGLTMEEFAGYMATLAQGGFKNMSDAGTSLKTMLLALQAPSETAAKAMAAINLEVYNAQGQMRPLGEILDEMRGKLAGLTEEQRNKTLKDIAGTDAIRAATIFMGDYTQSLDENSQRIRDNIEAMGLQGEAARVAQERNESFNGQVRILKATWEQLVITVGEQLLPALTALVKGLTGVIEKTQNLGEYSETLRGYLIPLAGVFLALKANVVATAGVAAWGTLTTALTSLGGAVTALGTSIATFVATNPLGALLVISAGIAMYANKINADIQSIYDSIERSENVSFSNLMATVQKLNAAGDALSKAQAKYLLMYKQWQDVQQANMKVDAAGRITYTDPKAIELAQKRLEAAKAELEAARAQQAAAHPNTLTGQGPLLPGQVRAGPASDYGLKVAQQTLKATGDRQADAVVDFCSKWVRLTLGRAQPEIAGYINRIFQTDANRDGLTEARDAAANARKAGLLRAYTGTQDLKPGDTVFYTDGGQNHAGIYIGNGMVRGNNRVSYKASGGKNPVGDVGINSLGRVSGIMRADDLYAAARGGVAPSAAAADATAAANVKLQQAIAEGRRLIRQYEMAMGSGNEMWVTKAHTAIEVFKKGNKEAWGPPLQQALADAEKAFKNNATSAKDAAEAAAVTEAQYKKLAPRARELAALEAKAKGKGPEAAAAARQIADWVKKNGEAAKQVLGYERAALRDGVVAAQKAAKEKLEAEKKAKAERENIERQATQGNIKAARNSLERLKNAQAQQLAAVKGNAAAEAKVRLSTAGSVAAATRKIAEAQLKADLEAAGKLPQANRKQARDNANAAYQNELRRIESERVQTVQGANKAISDEQARLNRQLLEGRVADAKATAQRIEAVHERELLNFRGTVSQREALVQRQANTEAAAARQIAEAQLRADKAAANKLGTRDERVAALKRAQTDYDQSLRETENKRLSAVKNSQKSVKEEEARLQRELLQGRVADANLTVERIRGIHERELLQFKGTLAERQTLLTRQATAEANARKSVAAAQKKIDDDEARKLTGQAQVAALRRSQATYDNALREIENNRLKAVQDAASAVKEEQARIDQQLAEGRVQDARLGLERLRQIHEQELMAFVGTAAQKEAVVRRQAKAQADAAEKVAAAQKKIDDAAANKLTGQLKTDALTRSLATYNNAVRDAQIVRDRAVQTAKQATAEEVKQNQARQKAAAELERQLRQLNERFGQQVSAGKVTTSSLTTYRQALENLQAKAKDLPSALQGTITALLAQGQVLATSGQQVADYKAEIDKLKDSVDEWSYAELQAGRARVLANGGDPEKLKILDAEIDKRRTLTTATLEQARAEGVTGSRQATLGNVQGEYENRKTLAQGNLAELYALEVEYGGNLQYLRDQMAQAQADDETRRINEKYDKLSKLEGVSDEQLREIEVNRTRDLETNATNLANVLAQSATQRTQAEREAWDNLQTAIRSSDRQTAETLLRNTLDTISRQTAALEAAQEEELSREDITAQETLDIRKRYQPQLVAQKAAELALTRQMEEGAEEQRYQDAVEAARKLGTLAQVRASLDAEHNSNMAAIERREIDSLRDYELTVKRDVGKALVALDKQTSSELVDNAKNRIGEQLDGLDSMDERQRQVARNALGFWRDVYVAMGNTGKAALAEVDDAIAKLDAAGRKARSAGGKFIVGDEGRATTDFDRDLNAVGKADNAESARASAESGFDSLRDTYRAKLSDIEAELRQFQGVADDALSPDERITRDGLLATSLLYNGFLDQIAMKAGEAGRKAADAFTQAQSDAAADAALQLAEIQRDISEIEGRDGIGAYRAGLVTALTYWKGRLTGLKEGDAEYAEVLRKVGDLEVKVRENSADAVADKEAELRLQQVEAEYALAQAEGMDGSPAYVAGINAALAYWRGRLLTLQAGTPEYIAAIQKIAELEGKAREVDPLANRFANLSNMVSGGSKFQKGIKAGLDGVAAYFQKGGSKGGKDSIIAAADALVTGLGEVFKTGDEDIDGVIDTFVSGIKGTLSALAKGDYIGAAIAGVTTVIMTIVDIIQGGANSARKAAKEIADATSDVKLFNLDKYARVVSRGGFWGALGFKKAEIDKEAVEIARTLGDALYEAISGGMLEGIKSGKASFGELNIDLKKSLAQTILQGLIDGFLKGEVMQKIIQPFLDQWYAARKTADPADDIAAAQAMQQAIVRGNGEMQAFYEGVLVPASQQLGVFGEDASGIGTVGQDSASVLGLADVPTGVIAAPSYMLENTAAIQKLTPVLERLMPMLDHLAQDGLSVRAFSEVVVRAQSDLRAHAL